MKCASCGHEVDGNRTYCAECLPPVAEIGRREWDRRYARLRRSRLARLAASGGHAEALRVSLQALEPSAGTEALVKYAQSLARQLDERPSASVGREYRLSLALLLDVGTVDPEDAEAMRAHAELVRVLSTPTR